jgi:hypothetical protein
MTGPKTFEEWKEAYEERGNKYILAPGEREKYHPLHGFFTYWYDAESKEIVIPKMCGDGKYWRPLIYKLALAGRRAFGAKGVYCCTEHNPLTWLRIHGGTLRKMEHTYDFTTGKSSTLWFIFITPEDTKEKRGGENGTFDTVTAAVLSTAEDGAR